MKKSKYNKHLENFKSWFICEITGENIPVEQYLDLYCKNEFAQIAGYELTDKNIDDTVAFVLNLYPELNEKDIRKSFQKLPAIALVFYLFRSFGFLNLDLFDLVFNFHISQDTNTRLEFAIRFIHMYLYYSVNRLIKNKYIIETEITDKEDALTFVIKNTTTAFSIKNIGSIRKVKDLIMEKELGIL